MFTLSGLPGSARSSATSESAGSPVVDAGVRHGWIPSGDRYLGVHVHEPTGAVRGATVVLATPAGRELVTLYRAMVHTARVLAVDGWRVVRFDWSGTAQSPEAGEAAPAELWAEDLDAVHRWAASYGPVHGVGVSVAGTILAASGASWASRLVCAAVSGKQWVRHQSALRRMSGTQLPPRVRTGTELLDLHLSPPGATWLKTLPLPDDTAGVTVLDEEETGPLPLNVHPRVAEVPGRFPDTVVAALAAADPVPSPRHGELPMPLEDITLTVDGVDVHLCRTRVGKDGRPAMSVAPVERSHRAPGLALISPGSEVMEVSGGAWLRTALAAASREGAVCLLAERTDTGELVLPQNARDSNPYTHRTLRETRELVTALAGLTDGPLLAAGICLGGWALGAAVSGLPRTVTRRLSLLIVNNVAWQRNPLRYWRQGVRSGPLAPALPGETEPEPSATTATASPTEGALPAPSRVRALKGAVSRRVAAVGRTVVRGARRRAREASPRVTSLTASAGLIDVPHTLLRSLASVPGLRVEALFGPEDAAFGGVSTQHVSPHGKLTVLETLDHSILATASRNALVDHVLTVVTRTGRERA